MSLISREASYAYCHELMRTAAKNFYYGMRLLPPAKRQAMYALYSYMRLIDDIADDPQTPEQAPRLARLEAWRADTHAAIAGRSAEYPAHPLWPAFADTVRRFGIPAKLLDEAIDGQVQDLGQSCYATFDELYQYCYRVASTVGIAALYIWGFSDPRALKLAEERGTSRGSAAIRSNIPR